MNHSVTKGNSPSFGQNYQKLGKELMSIDELAVLDGSKCILQLRGVRPFLSDKYDITQHKNYRYLSDFDDRNAFNMERFVNHKLEVKSTDEFDMMSYDATTDGMPSEAFSDFQAAEETIPTEEPLGETDEPDFDEYDPTDTELV